MIAVSTTSLLTAFFAMSLVGLIEPKLHVEFGISPLDGDSGTSSDVSITCTISDDVVNSGSMSNYDVQRCLIYKRDDNYGWTALAAISKAESTHVLLSNSKIIKAAGSIVESLNGSFIRLTWNRSDKDMYGQYRCDVEWKEYQNQSTKFADLKISSEDKMKISSVWKSRVEMLLTTELRQTIADAIIIKMDEKVENINNRNEMNGGDVAANVAANVADTENADVRIKDRNSDYDDDKLFEVQRNGTFPRIGTVLSKSHYTKRSLLSIRDDNETLSEKYLNNIKKTLNRQIIEQASEKYNGTIPNVNMEGSLVEILYNHTTDHENKMLEHLQNISNQLQHLKVNVMPSLNVLTLLNKYKDWRLLSILYERMDKREQMVKNLDLEMKKTLNDLYTPADSTEFIQWPRGTFALLKSDSGCPTNPIKPQKWLEGYRKFHTESSSGVNLNSFGENSHLALPINSTQGQDFFMTLHYCVKNTSTNEEPTWPKGSYCINRYNNCSVNFTEGRFHIDEEDTNLKKFSTFITSDPLSHTHSDLYFCCRSDGSPRDPITLPVFTPFYLYRFGGRCQSVLGMSYKEEFVHIDTENTGNNDNKQFPHVDGSINNVNITLCYYEMQSS